MGLMSWQDWSPRERAVLLFLREGSELLLIHKKRGLGTGKINAPGGRVEADETWEQAARRETREETGLEPKVLREAAELRFQFVDGYSLEVRVFLAEGRTGTLTACDEADPFWCPADQLPWDRMWADDALWLPPLLRGQTVQAAFLFEADAMREARVIVHEPAKGPQ